MGPLAALSGLRAAEVRFTNAASRIVNAPVQPVSAVPPALGEDAFSFQDEAVNAETASAVNGDGLNYSVTAAYAASDVSYITETVNMMEASSAYKANLQVLKTWDEMSSVIKDI